VSVSAVLAAGFGHNSCLSQSGSFLALVSGGIRFPRPRVPAISASAVSVCRFACRRGNSHLQWRLTIHSSGQPGADSAHPTVRGRLPLNSGVSGEDFWFTPRLPCGCRLSGKRSLRSGSCRFGSAAGRSLRPEMAFPASARVTGCSRPSGRLSHTRRGAANYSLNGTAGVGFEYSEPPGPAAR
jgi:hypothetical protein